MKPKILKMEAFGPFSKETVVDFDKFENGIFLISGDTGAGKTTIFDAIVFALFGEVSGSDRDIKMMHSDFVSNKVDSRVELLFEHAGKEYTVERKIHLVIKQGTEDAISNYQIKALFKKPDTDPITLPSVVTEEIEELLGMKKEQFCQIVMLAQGEFKKFLIEDDDRRAEILGKLFDNSNIDRYQELIKQASDRVEKTRMKNVENIAAIMDKSFESPEESADFDSEMWIPGNPNLLDNIQSLIDYEEEIIAEERKVSEEAKKELDKLNRLHGTVESRNKDIDELEKKREHLEELKSKAEIYDDIKKKCLVVSEAYRKVMPAVKNDREVKERLQKQIDTIAKLNEKIAESKKQKEKIEELLKNDEQSNKEIERLTGEIQSLNDSLESYDKLSKLQKNISDRKIKIQKDKDQLEQDKKACEELENQLKDNQEKLQSLENVDSLRAKVEEELSRKNERKDEIVGKDGLSKQISSILSDEDSLKQKEEEYSSFVEQARQLKAVYDEKYALFLEGQSGLLADQLRKELEEKGEALCPVCRTHFIKGTEYHFSELEENIPKQSEVDEAKKKFEEKEKERARIQSENEGLNARIEAQKQGALSIGQKLFDDCVDWSVLSGASYLTGKVDDLDKEIDKLKSKSDDLKSKQNLVLELKTKIEKATADKGELDKNNSSLSTGIEKETEQLKSWEDEYEALKNSLKYESEEEVQKVITDLSNQKTELSDIVKSHNDANSKIQMEYSELSGNLQTAEGNKKDLEEQSRNTDDELARVLSEVSFDSVADAENSLSHIENPERWLEENEKDYRDYDNDLKNTGDRVSELEEKTKDWAKQDIGEINSKINDQNEKCKQIDDRLNVHKNLRDNHDKVLLNVKAEKAALADTDYISKMLTKLSLIAGGSSGDGGKLSFYRYVLGLRFKEIIEKANYRLDEISSGRYQLVHTTTSSRKNRVAGLGIDIWDKKTKKQRASASLSGGESFVVSMSLALGLSDVVQSYSRGMSLNTLFIDEGFGTLDDDVLEKALKVLNDLSGNSVGENEDDLSKSNKRLVGVISHVSRLEEVLPKIVVKSGDDGSSIQ